MLRPVVIEGLTDQKIEQLEKFLDSLPRAMHFEHVDGFFCALICGPEPVPMSEFLPYVFGGQMPNFESSEQASAILGMLAEHWKHICTKLIESVPYYPFLYADKDEKCAANDWADAFMLGTQLRRESWKELLEDTSETGLLRQVLLLRDELSQMADGKEATIPSEERETLVTTLVDNLQKIYDHFEERRTQNSPQPAS